MQITIRIDQRRYSDPVKTLCKRVGLRTLGRCVDSCGALATERWTCPWLSRARLDAWHAAISRPKDDVDKTLPGVMLSDYARREMHPNNRKVSLKTDALVKETKSAVHPNGAGLVSGMPPVGQDVSFTNTWQSFRSPSRLLAK